MTVVSAPGKVLLAGGYLVLDPAYPGLVLATAARFYAVVRPAGDLAGGEPVPVPRTVIVNVSAAQFLNSSWRYLLRLDDSGAWSIKALSETLNPFVEIALLSSVRVASHLTSPESVFHALAGVSPASPDPSSVDLVVLADNDFYSQPRTRTDPVAPFSSLRCQISHVSKTGLGSSAALVTSLVGAILVYSKALTSFDNQTLLVHNLAQYAHSFAQHKVGSGFDISAAIYGSHIYHRFNAFLLDALIPSNASIADTPSAETLRKSLDPEFSLDWASHPPGPLQRQFALPPFTTLILADIDAGTNTPSFVSTLLKWAKQDPEAAKRFYSTINVLNITLAETFDKLVTLYHEAPEPYISDITLLSSKLARDWDTDAESSVQKALLNVRDLLSNIRREMKAMGNKAQVPIEPDEQTSLMNASQGVCHGILGQGVPGAGGYDALWSLCLTPPTSDAIPTLESFFLSYKTLLVRPLSSASRIKGYHASDNETLDQGNTSGIQLENLAMVPGLEEALSMGVSINS